MWALSRANICRIFNLTNSRFMREAKVQSRTHPTPMAGVKGRHEARKRVCHRARTLSSAPLRSSTTAFRDNSTSVPNRGASPSLVRVSGIDHTGPVQGRTERTRASTEAHERPRVRSKVLSSAGAQWLAGAGWRGRHEGERGGLARVQAAADEEKEREEIMPDRGDRRSPAPSVIPYP